MESGVAIRMSKSVGDHCHDDSLAGAARKRNSSADRLIRLARIDAELERHFDRLIELDARQFFQRLEGFVNAETAQQIATESFDLLSVKLAPMHRPPRFPCCARYLR